MSCPASVSSPGRNPSSPVLRSAPDVNPPSGLAAMDQDLPWSASLPVGVSADSPLLPAPLTPRRMVTGMVVPGSVVSSLLGDIDVAGGRPGMPDLSLEGPFDVNQDQSMSGTSPRVLDGMRGCQYRMTLYDQESGGPDFSPAYGIQLYDPRLLEYVCVPESSRLLSRSPEQFVTSFKRTSSEVMLVVSGGCHAAGGAVVPCSSGGSLYGDHGIVAAA